MTRFSCIAAAVCAALTLARPAASQSPLPLSLDAAVQRALERAPQLADAQAREAAADAVVRSRLSLGRPIVTATSLFLRTNHVEEFGIPQAGGTTRVLFPDIPSNYRLRAEAGIPLYTAGRVDALVETARADQRAVAADRRALEADLRLEVTRAYWMLVTSRESVRVLEQALARAEAWVRDVGARVDAGVLPPNEVASARAQRARQQVRLIQARNDAAMAQADVARLIGGAPGDTYDVTTRIDQAPVGLPEIDAATTEALIARAREQRPERVGLQERQSALRSNATAARSGTQPQVAAVAAIEPARPNARFVPRSDEWRLSWDLGVQLTWTLWDGGRAKADAATAEAQAQAVSHRLQQFDDVVALEVRQRVGDVTSGRSALAASDEAIAASTEAHRVVQERFLAGVAASSDVLEAQVAQLEAELERTRLLSALRLSEARLVRSLGGR